jgi:hypothetical protein
MRTYENSHFMRNPSTANFRLSGHDEVRRITLPRTPVNILSLSAPDSAK